MNILYATLFYGGLTGSELYAYELVRTLKELGHKVNVYCRGMEEPNLSKYDTLILNHKPFSQHLAHDFDGRVINICHSELLDQFEAPIISDKITHYVAIRPGIVQKLHLTHGIPYTKIKLIYNPIDLQRFYPKPPPKHKRKKILFAGSNDYLRSQVVEDLRKQKAELITVGRGFPIGPTEKIEEYVWDADETAGIMLGRTTLESWACNRPAWIYDVDERGNIKSKVRATPPKDLRFIDRYEVAKQIEALC